MMTHSTGPDFSEYEDSLTPNCVYLVYLVYLVCLNLKSSAGTDRLAEKVGNEPT